MRVKRKSIKNLIVVTELLTITSALEAVSQKTISLLTTDVQTRMLIRVSRETRAKQASRQGRVSLQVILTRKNFMDLRHLNVR